jgi:hypothetical protein
MVAQLEFETEEAPSGIQLCSELMLVGDAGGQSVAGRDQTSSGGTSKETSSERNPRVRIAP